MKLNWRTIFHDAFEVGITLKFLHGILEFFAGWFLLLRAEKLAQWLYNFSSVELQEDPSDWIATKALFLGHYFQVGKHWFPIIYLLFYSVLNIFLAIALWKKKMWAYPLACSLYSIFLVYQIYRYFIYHSPILLILTIVDALLIGLTWSEYKRLCQKTIIKSLE